MIRWPLSGKGEKKHSSAICHSTAWASFVGNSSTFTSKWWQWHVFNGSTPNTPMPSIVCSCPFLLPLGLSKIWCYLVLQEGGENLKTRNLKSKPINLCRFELFPSLLAAYHLRNIAYWTPDWSFAINDASLEVSPCCFSWETGNINICVNSNTLPPWRKVILVEFIGKPWVDITRSGKSCLVFFHFNTLANSRIESQSCEAPSEIPTLQAGVIRNLYNLRPRRIC